MILQYLTCDTTEMSLQKIKTGQLISGFWVVKNSSCVIKFFICVIKHFRKDRKRKGVPIIRDALHVIPKTRD